MGMTDPIADMITRIRNAGRVHFKSVDVFSSRMNQNIARVLVNSGYISGFEQKKDDKGRIVLRIYLKYTGDKKPVFTDLQRVSKPGRRVYLGKDEIPKVLNGYGISIITTSKGVMTDKEARALHVGGEVLCNVW
ncbi:MAG: 30S ribosomal protein S8 [Syntrophales bacterium]|nr:30S ribosomal protein S8 [Syntrophales bacterium]NLN60641.1 30S ribosomal protein S8 [Deltaproteobacteria bacterium]